MTMQNNIDFGRRRFWRNMHEPEFQAFTYEIDEQRPVLVPITISANHSQRRPNRFEIESNRRFANVAQVPDLVRLARKLQNLWRQLVMRVCENKNSNHQHLRKAGTQQWKARFGIFPAFLLSSAILHRAIQ